MSQPVPATSKELTLHLPAEALERLRARAAEEHCSEAELAAEAVVAFLDDDAWVAAVNEGLRAADEGRTVNWDEAKAYLRNKAAGRPAEKPRCG
ncbi:MAG: hypothetical protein HY904_13750 [Deltaproteobacteria bacterium]|nr:hypothetical protein [Deltaproteobacteria bacterium]